MTPNSTQVNFDPLYPTDWEKSTYYSRDAQGNVMAIYEYTVVDSTQQNNYTLTERNIYGSNRLGNNNEPVEMIAAPPVDTSKYVHYVGHRQYELSNHLGNVMSVISDRKIARDTAQNDTVDYYEPDVLLTFDYSPFGAPLHARSFSKEVCHDTTFTMTVEDLNTDFDDGTTQGWQILSTTTQLAVTGGRLRAYKQGKGAGTLGVQQSFMATSGFVYDFTITIENNINPASTVVLEVLDPNNTIIYTQSVSYPNTSSFTTQFTANTTGTYLVKVYRTGNNASGSIYLDDVLVTHEEEVNELICVNFGDYRWGYIGAENDNEYSGKRNSQEHKFRSYDPRLGRYKSVDPLSKDYPWNSSYAYAENRVIQGFDMEGKEFLDPKVLNKFISLGEAYLKVADDEKVEVYVYTLKVIRGMHKTATVEGVATSTFNYFVQVYNDAEKVRTGKMTVQEYTVRYGGANQDAKMVEGILTTFYDAVTTGDPDKVGESLGIVITYFAFRGLGKGTAVKKTGTSGGTRAGKNFTPKTKNAILEANKAKNNGNVVCEGCGDNTVPGKKSVKGVTPSPKEAQIDHIYPKSQGGDGAVTNGQVLCRECNIAKGDVIITTTTTTSSSAKAAAAGATSTKDNNQEATPRFQ